jgi:D-glucuronyl C5-epimerase-like protein
MRLAATGVVAAAALLIAPIASASSVQLAQRGLTTALRHHWLKAADVRRYRTTLNRAAWDARRLPKLRGQVVAAQIAQLAPLHDSYVRPRALALFEQLHENLQYLETHRLPTTRVDVTGDDGVVYRWFPGQGLEFHPLASFAELNATRDPDLAAALVARGIPRDGALYWEYTFRYGSGRPPWTSGMAQAVAAQALARAGAADAAARAYQAVPHLLMILPSGPWIRLYSFTSEIVLNAQLQTIVSLLEYSKATGDARAAGLADRLAQTAQTLFPRFDTGEWSRYELRGAYASRSYQTFVTTLLGRLGSQTQAPFWLSAAQRFRAYLFSPVQVTQTSPPPAIWPQPLDGYLDTAPIAITLSQRASVTLAVGGVVSTYRLGPGPHVLTWKPPAGLGPGTYPAQLSTVTYAGNRGTVTLAPVTVQWDTEPPAVTATVAGGLLSWQSTDAGTPWLALAIDLVDPSGLVPPQTLDLGQHSVSGTAVVTIPPGTWQATLRATNSAGLTTTVDLGQLTD